MDKDTISSQDCGPRDLMGCRKEMIPETVFSSGLCPGIHIVMFYRSFQPIFLKNHHATCQVTF
ncbi:MAG: hypothetical protein PHT99_09535, partial [Methanoregula sp.]|nr:hypothetical protein [Methanoregula sp.]